MRKFIFGLTLFFVSLSISALDIPLSDTSHIAINGILKPGEWRNAMEFPFADGKSVFIKADEQYFFLALEGDKGGFASLCLNQNDKITVLHSSTRLITAQYAKEGSSWKLTSPFTALDSAVRSQPVNHNEQIQEFGWTSNIVEQGPPEQTEFKIDKDLFDGKTLKVSLVFFQFRADQQFARLPAHLSDGSLNRDLIMGGKVDSLSFDTDSWVNLKLP